MYVPVSSSNTPSLLEGWAWDTGSAALPRIGFTVYGSSDNVGFVVDLTADNAVSATTTGSGLGWGDQQKVWFKPFDGVKLEVGNVFEDTLRGNYEFGSYNWIRTSGSLGDDITFTRITASKGIVLSYTGVENLFIGANIDSDSTTTTAKIFEYGQYAVGYTIPSVGTIRAQYMGDATASRIEGAFKLAAVQNLNADIGVKYNITGSSKTEIGFGANYKIDALTINAIADATITTATTVSVGAGVDYAFDGGIGISADVRDNDVTNNGQIGGGLFVTKGFSNGVIGIGAEFVSKGGFGSSSTVSSTDATAVSFAIPIKVA
jgi:hypothetical protein